MKRYLFFPFILLLFSFLSGCAVTIPMEAYVPQNFVRYDNPNNSIDMGSFTYIPQLAGKISPNQIENVGLGTIYISSNIAELSKRATALELEKTGFKLKDDSQLMISGDILEFKAYDIGYSVDWTYAIRYIITDKKKNTIIYKREYRPEARKSGKLGRLSDYSSIINDVILSGYDLFIRDSEVKKLLDIAQSKRKK